MKKCSRVNLDNDKRCLNLLKDTEGNLPLSEFCQSGKDKNGNSRLDTLCKDCRRRDRILVDRTEYLRKYDSSDVGRNNQYKKRGYKLNGKNFTVDDYNKLLNKQNGTCAICGKKEIGRSNIGEMKNNFIVDHDHETGEVRGLLCNGCNRSIGYLGNVFLLDRAIQYLKKNLEI